MASYLATVDIGQFDLRFSRAGDVRIIDAVDPDLYNRMQPRTGDQFALSQSANLTYKRLTHIVDVPRRRCQPLHLGHARHRAELGLLLRRGAHRRRRRLDHPPRRQRPHEHRHWLCVPAHAGAAPVPGALRDRQRRRHLLADGNDGDVDAVSDPSDGYEQ